MQLMLSLDVRVPLQASVVNSCDPSGYRPLQVRLCDTFAEAALLQVERFGLLICSSRTDADGMLWAAYCVRCASIQGLQTSF